MKKEIKIKPHRGVTYECYMGYTDHMGNRVRRGQQYFLMGELRDYWVMMNPDMKGHCKSIGKKEFTAHFIPLNPLNALYVPLEDTEYETGTLCVPSN